MAAVSRLERTSISAQRWALRRLLGFSLRKHPPHLLVGERGELEALFFLRLGGYVVVARRWRAPECNGDLDLIAYDGETLCFVEVKTRSRRDNTPAASAIDYGKKQMLRRMADAYRRTLPASGRYTTPFRFDVVSVYLERGGPTCELVRSAFGA